MRKLFIPALFTTAFLSGCGGSSEVEIATYTAETFEPVPNIFLSKIESSGGTEFLIGQANGVAFLQTAVPHRGIGFPDQLGIGEDIIKDVNSSGLVVGYDSTNTPETPGLKGDSSSFVPNALSYVLTEIRHQYHAINGLGDVGTVSIRNNGQFVVSRWTTNGSIANITALPDMTSAHVAGLDDNGKLCGTVQIATVSHAFSTNQNQMVDLGLGVANGMNASGVIVGQTSTKTPYRTGSGNSTTRTALPLLPGFTIGEALDVNDSGVIVGWQAETEKSPHVPVAWYVNGALVDLRTRVQNLPAGIDLLEARSIANNGTVALAAVHTGTDEPLGMILRLN